MSCSLCCGTLNVSQLTIPALPTSEIERLGQDDSASLSDSESLFDLPTEEPSSMSILCDNDQDDPTIENEGPTSDSPITKDNNSELDKSVVRKKVPKPHSSRKKMDKDLSHKKKSKFWTFKLKRRSLPLPAVRGGDTSPPKPPFACSPDFQRPEVLEPQQPFGATCPMSLSSSNSSSTTSSSSSPLPNVAAASLHRMTMGAGPSPSSLAAELHRFVPLPATTTFHPDFTDLHHIVPAVPPRADENLSAAAALSANVPVGSAQRARDIELGIEIGRSSALNPNHHSSAYPHFQYPSSARNSLSASSSSTTSDSLWSLTCSFQNQCSAGPAAGGAPRCMVPSPMEPSGGVMTMRGLTTFGHGRAMDAPSGSSMQGLPPPPPCLTRTAEYTQVDYIHCLVPDLHIIANCSFYWGVMDRYEAESLLENRPEGTFLLRDSAQDDFLFSVSFRRYSRSLHARIDQWNHKFSFDTHDPGVFSADTVTDLIEHYKDPNCCMFFEPMLTRPLCRNFPFSLQHLCRSVICGMSTYDSVNCLPLPKSLVEYLKYYHYKQKVRVRKLLLPV